MFPRGITESINLLIKLYAESKFSAILNYSKLVEFYKNVFAYKISHKMSEAQVSWISISIALESLEGKMSQDNKSQNAVNDVVYARIFTSKYKIPECNWLA